MSMFGMSVVGSAHLPTCVWGSEVDMGLYILRQGVKFTVLASLAGQLAPGSSTSKCWDYT